MRTDDLHPEAEEPSSDFLSLRIRTQEPVHEIGVCGACDAWRLQARERDERAATDRLALGGAPPRT